MCADRAELLESLLSRFAGDGQVTSAVSHFIKSLNLMNLINVLVC